MPNPNILQMLFGQQAASTLAGDNAQTEFPNGYEVNGTPPSERTPVQPSASEIDQYLTMGLNNTEAIRQRDAALKAGEAEANRKGMFGVGGTLRDVLGVLGDAFLVQSGNKAIYSDRRDKERISDAMAGSSVNPMAAYERRLGIDPDGAEEFRKNYVTGQNASTRNAIDQQEAARKLYNDAMSMASQMMAAAVGSGDPVQIERAKAGITLLSQQTKIPVEQLMAGESPEVIAGRGATSYQNLRLPQQERSLDQADERIRVAWANARNAQERTKIMREAFSEKMDENRFNRLMDMFGMSQDVIEENGRNSRGSGRRDTQSSGTGGGGWTIRPAGQ